MGWPKRQQCAFTRVQMCHGARICSHTQRNLLMGHPFPSNSLWLLSIISLGLLMFFIEERNCTGVSNMLTKSDLSNIVILSNNLFPEQQVLLRAQMLLVRHIAP